MDSQALEVDGDRDVRVDVESYRLRGAIYAAGGVSGPSFSMPRMGASGENGRSS